MPLPDLAQELERLEFELLDPAVRHSRSRLESLLAAGFIEFGSSGRIFGREAVIAALAAEAPTGRMVISNFAVVAQSTDIAVVRYRITCLPVTAEPPHHSLRSSVWELCEGRWQMRFHQGTREPDLPRVTGPQVSQAPAAELS